VELNLQEILCTGIYEYIYINWNDSNELGTDYMRTMESYSVLSPLRGASSGCG
jgi:hypothetical protein